MNLAASRVCVPIVTLAIASACARGVPAGGFRIDVSEDLAKVSIESRGAPLANILQALHTDHGIDVRLNQDVNPQVTVSVSGVPLDDAVRRLVPEGTRYIVRAGAREWRSGVLQTGSKSGAAVAVPPGAIAKGAQRPSPTGTVIKRAVDAIPAAAPIAAGPRAKASPTSMLEVPRGTGPKRTDGAGTQPAVRTLRLRLTMSDSGAIRVDSAVVVDGAPPAGKPVVGPYLYGVRRADGSLVDFGSFSDPLVEHSFRQEDQRHDERRAREGSFAISIPGVTPAALTALTLQIYDARTITLPAALTRPAFDELSRRATALRAITGQEMARASQGRRQ